MSQTQRKWIAEEIKGENLVEMILNQSGIEDKEYFLNGKIEDIPSITLIEDGQKAVKILRTAIQNNDKIGIHYDYDTDGVGGGSASYLMLKELGANVFAYSNNRFKLGYGICKKAIDDMIEQHPDIKIILTVDNGISAIDAIKYAKDKGLIVIITDHHEPGEELPIADAIINAKIKNCGYPFTELCGAGVVWKLISELYEDRQNANKYLDIVSISTVGDVVPLVDENRLIVKKGLELLRNESRLSLRILKEETKTDRITSDSTLGFLYSPIFNAISRINGDISLVFDMLVSEDEKFIRKTCKELIRINNLRKEKTNNQLELAEKLIKDIKIEEVIVIYDETFDEGVVGLIAGRIKEQYNRPTIVLTRAEDGSLKGSGRSIEGFNMKENLDKVKELLLGYGGHYMAGGLSIIESNLEEFKKRIIEIAKYVLTEDDLVKKFRYNFTITEDKITIDLIKKIESLEPFGQGFKSPVFKIKDFKVDSVQFMGQDNDHLKLKGERISMISWRNVLAFKERGNPMSINALGSLSINTFRDIDYLQFMVIEDNFY